MTTTTDRFSGTASGGATDDRFSGTPSGSTTGRLSGTASQGSTDRFTGIGRDGNHFDALSFASWYFRPGYFLRGARGSEAMDRLGGTATTLITDRY
jgi:hypothetical protein